MTSEITRLHKMGFHLREGGRRGCMAVSRDGHMVTHSNLKQQQQPDQPYG